MITDGLPCCDYTDGQNHRDEARPKFAGGLEFLQITKYKQPYNDRTKEYFQMV